MPKGYTLIELLAASAIFAGMMIVAVGIFSVSASQEGIASNRRIVHQSARSAVDSIIREVANSKNQEYDSDGKVIDGAAGFVIVDWDLSNFNLKNQNQNKLTSGNALIVAYNDSNNVRQLKAYYLCSHKTYASWFTLGVKELGISDYQDRSQNGNWNLVKNQVACDNNWKRLTSNEVVIKSLDDLNITGIYPDKNINKQPYITVTLRAINAQGTQAAEKVSSTYRATIVHRDYGYSGL